MVDGGCRCGAFFSFLGLVGSGGEPGEPGEPHNCSMTFHNTHNFPWHIDIYFEGNNNMKFFMFLQLMIAATAGHFPGSVVG